MSKEKQIEKSIQRLAGTYLKDLIEIYACNVDSVDADNRVCDCTPIGGNAATQLPGVQLCSENNNGLVVFPKVGSTVIVALSTRNTAFVLMFSDIDKVEIIIGGTGNYTSYKISNGAQIFNDGSFNGLIKIDQLTTKLNTLISQVQAQLALISTGITGVGGVYAPGTLSTLNKTDYENTLITHGK